MDWRTAAVAAAVGLTTAACGSSGSATGSGGEQVFAHSCSGCHTLSGHNSPSHQGGDLLDVHLSRPVMLQFATEMPVRHALSAGQLSAVVDYILAVQRRGG